MSIANSIVLKIWDKNLGDKLKKILPNFMFNIVQYIYSFVFFHLTRKQLISKNSKLNNVGKGKRAFVLATGPSIKGENLKNLKGEDCFSVSNFFLHDDINVINPLFHFFGPYHKPLILENYVEWLRLADQTLPKNTNIFLSYTTKQYVDKYKLFPHREIFYLYYSDFSNKKSYDITHPIIHSGTGPQMIIQVLIYMGYSKIYLLGCDHNSLKTRGEDRIDFYDRKKDIRKNATDKNAWKDLIFFLENQLNVFKQYNRLGDIAKKRGIEIINLSKDSWIETFKKDSLDKILKAK